MNAAAPTIGVVTSLFRVYAKPACVAPAPIKCPFTCAEQPVDEHPVPE